MMRLVFNDIESHHFVLYLLLYGASPYIVKIDLIYLSVRYNTTFDVAEYVWETGKIFVFMKKVVEKFGRYRKSLYLCTR